MQNLAYQLSDIHSNKDKVFIEVVFKILQEREIKRYYPESICEQLVKTEFHIIKQQILKYFIEHPTYHE